MKKRIISIVIIVLIIIFIVFKIIIPNILLKTDLFCERISEDNVIYKNKIILTVAFNKKGLVDKVVKNDCFEYNKKSTAEQVFEEYKTQIGKEWENFIKLDNQTIIFIDNNFIVSDEKKLNKKLIKKRYEDLGYECK